MPMKPDDRGATLVETMIAILVAFIAMSGIGVAVFRASVTNKNEGSEQARLTVLAQEKAEGLLRLDYGVVNTNTTLITDTGWAKGLTAGGGRALVTDCSASTVPGYVDFQDINGASIAGTCSGVMASTNANGTNAPYAYQRRWLISDLWGDPEATNLGTGDGSVATFSTTLTRIPVKPLAVNVTAGVVTGADDGLGGISGTGIAIGTINYNTGAISVTFSPPPAPGVPVNVVTTTLAGLKQMTVVVFALNAVNAGQKMPSVSMTTMKSQ